MSIRSVPVALIAATLALVAVGGAALAFGRGGSDTETRDDLLERAATELGVEPQVLKDALSTAQSELAAERQQEVLDDLVADGVITQEQADEAGAWLDEKPAVLDRLTRPDVLLRIASLQSANVIMPPEGALNLPILGDDVMEKMAEILGIDVEELREALQSARSGQAEDRRSAAIDEIIQQFIDDEEISEAEGEDIKAWIDAMPEWLNDDHMLMQLFVRGVATNVFKGAPFLHDLPGGRFEIFPHLEGLRREHERFIVPDGLRDAPRFEFRAPGGSFERFFFRGPNGNFEFNGELPEDLESLLDQFEGQPNFDELDDLFERIRPFRFHEWEEAPDDEPEADGQEAAIRSA